jgi:hypothetical protein
MSATSNDLRQRFTQVFQEKWADENHPQYTELLDKFVFHMIDAAAEIRSIADLLENPNASATAGFGKLLHRFFLHAVPHLVAAGQLYDYIPELFAEQRGVHGLSGCDVSDNSGDTTPGGE